MTLPVSGAISFNAINVELGVAGTTQASLGQASYRTLAGVPSGAISMSNFYGKSNRVALSYTYSANTANAALNLSAISGYVSGKSDITVTINTGVYVYATTTGGYGLNITGGATGDTLTIVNNGFIMGMGGAAGYCSGSSSTTPGSVGGPAINFGFALSGATVTNTSGYIGGGGGGGGAVDGWCGGGGGAGGGAGGTSNPVNGGAIGGGAGGGPGSAGSNGSAGTYNNGETLYSASGGGGGGRIIPGTGGSASSGGNATGGGGAGGGGGSAAQTGTSGGGGSAGNAGGSGSSAAGGGGGGWGASGGSGGGGGAGGGGGKAVNLNAKTITWTGGASSSSRAYGAVS